MRAIGIPVLLMVAITMPGVARAQSQERFVLTTEQVARALTLAGMTTPAAQVSLPARVVALAPYPALDIVSIQPIRKGSLAQPSRSVVKLACRQPGECLPFYATVNGAAATSMETASKPSPIATTAGRISRKEFTMPAGTRAILLMEDDRSHIQVAVVSLENGMAGHWIRVASPDHKQIYFAEVVNASLLRGNF
ncbi:MAG: hypothetical protein WA510_31490 [Acidobacteriaceae bacterium]